MTKLYLHIHKFGFQKWIPVIWYCVDCDRLGDRIRVGNLKIFCDRNMNLYRKSNRKNERGWIVEAQYDFKNDKVIKL